MLLSMILIDSYMIIHYIVQENILLLFLFAFITEEILKHLMKDCFKINDKQTIKVPKKSEYVKLKNFEKKIELSLIYADF